MIVLQLACLAILALFVAVRVGGAPTRSTGDEPDRRTVIRRLVLLAIASWIGEETCIRLYGFYFYSPAWSLPIDRVPVMIPLIWPVVIHSAHDLARHVLGPGRRPGWVALLGGAIVLADASLIEPIAVQAGLWTWTEPGIFSVPPIGILGWAFFAAAAMLVFERWPRAEIGVLVLAPLATHALLLASWWGAFRWISGTIPPWPVVGLSWALSFALAARAHRARLRERIPAMNMVLRIPAAAFFFVLLVLRGRDIAPLVAYAVAFAPPYLAMTRLRDQGAGSLQQRNPTS